MRTAWDRPEQVIKMLHFLLWGRIISQGQFDAHLARLKTFAWYAPEIWKYSDKLAAIIHPRAGCHPAASECV